MSQTYSPEPVIVSAVGRNAERLSFARDASLGIPEDVYSIPGSAFHTLFGTSGTRERHSSTAATSPQARNDRCVSSETEIPVVSISSQPGYPYRREKSFMDWSENSTSRAVSAVPS